MGRGGMRIVGLGAAGCNLARAFAKFSQYETVGIDSEKGADITIRKQASHEEYDTNFPNLKKKLKFSNEEVVVITAGSGRISGGILRLLEQLQNNRLTVLYLQSDLSLAGETQKIQERIVANVLQEYARSGALEAIWLIDNHHLAAGLGDIPIMGYYDVLNQAIVNMVHMVNVFKNSQPVIGNFIEPSSISRIATFGIVDMETSQEKWFYDLTTPRDVVYYYGINENELKEDGSLFKTITEFVKSKLNDNINVSYGVFQTTYDQKYCYCIKYSSMVQSFIETIGDQDIS
jgi:hypothetical protein